MSKFHRSERPPAPLRERRRDVLTDTRGVLRDEDFRLIGTDVPARGTPLPDYAIDRRRRPRSSYRAPTVNPNVDCTPREHAEHVRIAQHNFDVCVTQVSAARERGDESERLKWAELARERRATLLALTGGTERRAVDVDQGSAVNPMVAV